MNESVSKELYNKYVHNFSFFDLQTSNIEADFGYYNPNNQMISYIKIKLDLNPTGVMVSSHKIVNFE